MAGHLLQVPRVIIDIEPSTTSSVVEMVRSGIPSQEEMARIEGGRMMKEHMIRFRIGGKVLLRCSLNPSEAVVMIQQYPTCWVFACARGKGQKLEVDQVNEDYLSTVSSISILPALCDQNHGVQIPSELTGV